MTGTSLWCGCSAATDGEGGSLLSNTPASRRYQVNTPWELCPQISMCRVGLETLLLGPCSLCRRLCLIPRRPRHRKLVSIFKKLPRRNGRPGHRHSRLAKTFHLRKGPPIWGRIPRWKDSLATGHSPQGPNCSPWPFQILSCDLPVQLPLTPCGEAGPGLPVEPGAGTFHRLPDIRSGLASKPSPHPRHPVRGGVAPLCGVPPAHLYSF